MVKTESAKVKIGLVGLNFGQTIAREIAAPNIASKFELIALCDRDEALLTKYASQYHVTGYASLDDMLRDDEVEAIGLFTGPIGRAELIRKIIRTGRHVMTTKPLEMNPDAMLDVLHEARRSGCIVHCNSPGPILSQDIRIIQRWIKQYDLGRPTGAHADVWVSYREAADGTWYDDTTRCPAAPIYRLGIYLINDLVKLWGKVEEVHLQESRIFTGRPTSDNAQLSLRFENKALATIYASFCVKDGDHYRNGLTLNFENGTIYRNTGPAWSPERVGQSHLALVKEQQNEPLVMARETASVTSGTYQWDYFFRAIQGEVDPHELSADDMVEGIRVIGAMTKLAGGS